MSRTPESAVALGSVGVAGKGPEENERRPLRGLVPRVPASARPEVPERGRSSPAARMAVACELAESLGPESPRKARVCAREDVCVCVVIMGHFQNGANRGLSTSQGRGSSFSVPALCFLAIISCRFRRRGGEPAVAEARVLPFSA